ncbi:class I SAM-dependent methyltransferase [Paenibacillus terrigena]|uniref:class I SAM-dependent methyltransferase n=1 Tax=Paenibacillus terrigena TaxID=369333 RepID=UPI0003803F0B|nr:class I SAM-dependent methyltransferase [Paenibacillus terrigena]
MYSENSDAGVLSMLQPQAGERILDVGSGNGDLMSKIAAAGAVPIGIDMSEGMVNRARQKYPELDFQVADASQYRTENPYDAVFSHATLHWILDAASVTRSIWLALRDGGRFVTEFAGRGNVAVLTTAIQQALESHGYAWAGRNPWYHPTIGEYASLLERTGFRVMFAHHFDKPTPLKREAGVRIWLDSFSDYFFHDVTAVDKASIYNAIEAQVKPLLYRNGQWMIDTSRLRIVAIKERS